MTTRAWGALGVLLALTLTTGCGGDAAPPSTAASSPALTPTTSPSAPTTAQRDPDAVVCGSLQKLGESFYREVYAPTMRREAVALEPGKLAAQLAALTTLGAEGDSIDGVAAILAANESLALAATKMVRDADRLAQRFLSAAVPNPDITEVATSFTETVVACEAVGKAPGWFSRRDLG